MIKQLRFIYRYVIAYITRHFRYIVTSFVAGFFFFYLLYQISPFVQQLLAKEGKIVGIVGLYTPETLPIQVQRLIGVGLTEVAENGEAKPALSKQWDISTNGKEYTFTLRKDIYWHDGKSFTAKDINYNIRGVTLKAENDTTLKVLLKEPFVPLPALLSRPLFRPGLIGLGPYKVTDLKLQGDRIRFMQLAPVYGGLPKLILKFYNTEDQARIAFKLGEIDVLDELSDPGEFKSWPSINTFSRIDHTRYVALFYNLNDKILTNKIVRQGLSFGVPNFDYDRATGPISPLSWAYNTKVRQYKFDLPAAQRLLGKDTASSESAELTISTFVPYISIAKRIAESWQTLGFSVNVKIEDSVPDTYQVLLASQEIPPDPDQYQLWHSTQKDTNVTHFDNKKIDKLLEEGRVTLDKEQRLKIYQDFQKYLVDEAPATFLYYPRVYSISRK